MSFVGICTSVEIVASFRRFIALFAALKFIIITTYQNLIIIYLIIDFSFVYFLNHFGCLSISFKGILLQFPFFYTYFLIFPLKCSMSRCAEITCLCFFLRSFEHFSVLHLLKLYLHIFFYIMSLVSLLKR